MTTGLCLPLLVCRARALLAARTSRAQAALDCALGAGPHWATGARSLAQPLGHQTAPKVAPESDFVARLMRLQLSRRSSWSSSLLPIIQLASRANNLDAQVGPSRPWSRQWTPGQLVTCGRRLPSECGQPASQSAKHKGPPLSAALGGRLAPWARFRPTSRTGRQLAVSLGFRRARLSFRRLPTGRPQDSPPRAAASPPSPNTNDRRLQAFADSCRRPLAPAGAN